MAKAAKKETAKKDSKKTEAKKPAAKAKAVKAEKAEPKKAAKKEAPAKEKVVKATVDADVETSPEAAPAPVKEAKAKKPAKERPASEESKKWIELKEKHGAEKAPAYSMSGIYEANHPLQHKVLGWGWIMSVQNDRLEVLFEEGTKMLISNYKPR